MDFNLFFINFLKLFRYSRSRSISKSKEKRENRNSGIKAFKPFQNFLNNSSNNQKSSIKNSKVTSKVRTFHGNKIKNEMQKNSNSNNEKSKLRINEIKKKDLQLNRQNKKIISVPLKNRKMNEFKNNGVTNQRPKIKAESSLKKLFSENPLLKKTKEKNNSKKKNTPKKTIGNMNNEKNEIIMSVNKSDLLNNYKNGKSTSPVNLKFLYFNY